MRSSGATSATGTLLGTLVGMVMRGSIMAAVLCGFRRVQLPPVAQGRARATPTGERLLASLLVLEILVEQKSWWPHLKPLTKRGGGPALNPHNLKPRAFLQEIVTWRFAPSGSAGRAVVQSQVRRGGSWPLGMICFAGVAGAGWITGVAFSWSSLE